jgi:hypothetical protein
MPEAPVEKDRLGVQIPQVPPEAHFIPVAIGLAQRLDHLRHDRREHQAGLRLGDAGGVGDIAIDSLGHRTVDELESRFHRVEDFNKLDSYHEYRRCMALVSNSLPCRVLGMRVECEAPEIPQDGKNEDTTRRLAQSAILWALTRVSGERD